MFLVRSCGVFSLVMCVLSLTAVATPQLPTTASLRSFALALFTAAFFTIYEVLSGEGEAVGVSSRLLWACTAIFFLFGSLMLSGKVHEPTPPKRRRRANSSRSVIASVLRFLTPRKSAKVPPVIPSDASPSPRTIGTTGRPRNHSGRKDEVDDIMTVLPALVPSKQEKLPPSTAEERRFMVTYFPSS